MSVLDEMKKRLKESLAQFQDIPDATVVPANVVPVTVVTPTEKEEPVVEITDEMRTHFDDRTNRHIGLVQKYVQKIADADPDNFGELPAATETHDQSKFEEPEYEPYVILTWQYKCKDDGVDFPLPDSIKDSMNKATEHHIKSNSHHPECHAEKEVDLINREDRDKPPDEMIDATSMPQMDVAEMVADWCAMSEERGNSPREWADKNVNVRWKFTPDQSNTIYSLMDKVWEPVEGGE